MDCSVHVLQSSWKCLFPLSFIHLAIHSLLGDPEDLEGLAEVAAGLVAMLLSPGSL